MEALVLVGVVLLVGAFYSVITLAVLINFDVVPRPDSDQIVAWLDWHRVPRVRILEPFSSVAGSVFNIVRPVFNPSGASALAATVIIAVAIGDLTSTRLTMPKGTVNATTSNQMVALVT